MTVLEILTAGPLTLIQDLGRAGLGHIGVTDSGAADRRSHRLANRLVANPAGYATVEITLGGFSARVRGGAIDVAVTGADGMPEAGGTPFGINSVYRVHDGQDIVIHTPSAGLRSYLAVRGGFALRPVLGSCSHDTLSGIGPPPLCSGDELPVGPPPPEFPTVGQAAVEPIRPEPAVLRVVRGPRADWLVDADALVRTRWRASASSDRVGVRLTGDAGATLAHRDPSRELPSEGLLRGAIQVPPNGLPVILGPDHPVTGGYPVIGVVVDDDTDTVAQLRPGQPVQFRWRGSH